MLNGRGGKSYRHFKYWATDFKPESAVISSALGESNCGSKVTRGIRETKVGELVAAGRV